ncbi:hypothetical protein ACOMHN_028084 [Nucella lapillus]
MAATTETTTTTTNTKITDYIYPPPLLTTLDFSFPSVKLTVLIAAVVTSILIYVMTQIVFTLTSSLYRNLRLKERVFWNLAVVRSCFGIFSIVSGLWAIFVDTVLSEDVVFATSPASHCVIIVAVGFFLFECLAVTASDVYFRTFSCLLQIHHWVALVGLLLAMTLEAGHAFGCQGLLLEMTTPFSCLCWTLLKANRQHTLLWKANQFLLLHTFHLRNAVEMKLWYLTWQNWGNVYANMPLPLFLVLYLQLAFITVFMTPYWTWKKSRQMFFPVDWNFEGEDRGKVLREKVQGGDKKVLVYEVGQNVGLGKKNE